MNIDWKALKKQKQEELPAAEIARQKRINNLVDIYERRLYLACKQQEAGTSHCYEPSLLDDYSNRFLQYLIGSESEFIEETLHREVMRNLCKRLTSNNVNCQLMFDDDGINITLP